MLVWDEETKSAPAAFLDRKPAGSTRPTGGDTSVSEERIAEVRPAHGSEPSVEVRARVCKSLDAARGQHVS
jgi:hypothetical protein